MNKWSLIADGVIIICIIILVAGWLPSGNLWILGLEKEDAKTEELKKLMDFKHPAIPISKLKSIDGVEARAYILVDSITNKIIASKNPVEKIYPASTTKLATALTALNIFALDEVVTVNSEYKEGKVMELKSGEKITIKSLVTALLVFSANDAAYNLANHHSGGVDGFVGEMNQLAKKYHLSGSHFTNYDGIDNQNHYSTVYDLSQFARLAIKNPIIRETVKEKELTVSDIENKIEHRLTTTNELLGQVKEIEGLKTGWTPEAGGCFVGLINIDGHELISVVAQSDDRFADTKKIVDWAKSNVVWGAY